jgi:hypothetical protein
MIFSYILYIDYKKTEKGKKREKTFDNFKENDDFNEDEIEIRVDKTIEGQSENINLN